YAQRVVLARDATAVELIVDDLPDACDVVGELPQDRNQRRRDDDLRDRKSIRGFDLVADRLVGVRQALVALAEMNGPFSGYVPRRLQSQPERGHNKIVAAAVVLAKVINVHPLGVA